MVCDSYSGGCPSPLPTSTSVPNPPDPVRELPFTGGEVVLTLLLGLVLVVAGYLAVVAARR